MDHDREMLRLWSIVSEITEQLNLNKTITSRLLANAGQLQDQAGQASNGATLRRFNVDLSKENFASELERLSVALVMENQSLLHENKQLSTLMQEYEQTLETVMTKFRGHCQAAQTHQLTLSKHYETLLSRERGDDVSAREMGAEHLDTLATLVRRAIGSMEGRDPTQDEPSDPAVEASESHEKSEAEEEWEGIGNWAEERETEIQRLEKENAELRHALGISQAQERELGLEDKDQPTPSPSSTSYHPFPRPNSFRDDRGRGGGRPPLGLPRGGCPQRRPGVPAFVRRGLGDAGPAPERVASPPNDIRWSRDVASGPVVESI